MILVALSLSLSLAPAAPQSADPAALDGDARTVHLADVAPSEVRAALARRTPGLPIALGSAECGDPTLDVLAPTGDVEGDGPVAAAFTPDGTRLVVANRVSRNLTVFDVATPDFVGAVALSGSPQEVAIASGGATAVTANLFEDTVSIVDLATLSETAVVPVGEQPGLVRITPDGARAVVGNTVGQSVSVVDLATATELHRIPGAGFSASLTLTGESGVVTVAFQSLEVVDDATAIHTDWVADEIDFFDLAAGTVSSLPCAPDPRGLDVAPGTAVVVHTGSVRTVSVVDLATPAVTQTISTSVDLREHVALRPDATRAVVGVLNGVVVVDLLTSGVSPVLSTASVNGMDTTADGDHALTYGFQGALVAFDSQSVVAQLNGTKSAYAGAVSPAGPRGVMLVNHNAEDMVVVDTSGAAGAQLGVLPTGPAPEADSPRRVAVTPDGTRAVTTNILSDNVTVLDLGSGDVLGVVPVGDRPSDVEITPDGGLAVVANLDSTFASLVDLATLTRTDVPISTRGGEVEIAPDGAYAYVAVVVADGVWRIDLATQTTSGPKLPVGQMGSVFYGYQQSSGLSLSADGATLATCDSFDDQVTLIDTASWSVQATVPVGDFPTRAAFSPDGSRLFVANKNDDTLTVVDVANGQALQTVAVGDAPFELVASADGSRVFVLNTGDDTVGVVDVPLGLQIAVAPLPATPQGLHLNGSGTCLSVASLEWLTTFGPGPNVSIATDGWLTVLDAASLAVANQVPTALPSAALGFDGLDGAGLVPSPNGDRIARVRFAAPELEAYGCTAPVGSFGLLAGSPKLATQFVVGVDNPLGTQAPGALPAVVASLAPDPAFPCGTPLPGLGMTGGGAAGELLVSLLPGQLVLVKSGTPWTGPGVPAPVDLNVPLLAGLVGVDVFLQGLLVNPPGQPGVPSALAGGLRLGLGL